MNRRTSVAAALVSAACFGTLAVFTSLAYARGAQPLQLLTWRFALAALILGGYVALTRPRSLVVPIADIGRYAVISIGGYGAASICFFFALTYTDASVVAILLYTYPVMVTLAERVFYGIRLTRGRASAVALTFSGCVLVVDPFASGGSTTGVAGIVLGLGAAACYSAFSMLSHRWLEGRPRLTLMTYLFIFTSLLSACAAVVTGTSLAVTGWDLGVWSNLAGIVVLPTFVAIVLYLRALRGLGAGQTAILSTFEPVFTIVLAAAVLRETMSVVQVAGALAVLAGVLVAERSTKSAEEIALV